MSVQAMTWVLERSEAPGSMRFLLLVLANHHNERTGQCNPGYDLLAHEMRMSRSAVIRLVQRAVDGGHLEVVRGGDGRGATNAYAIVGYGKGRETPLFQDGLGSRLGSRFGRESAIAPSLENQEPTPTGADNGAGAPSSAPPGDDEATIVRTIVACYVDDYRAACGGNDPPRDWRSIAGREARKALHNGVSPEDIKGCLWQITQERVKNPARLAYVISDAQAGVHRRPTR